MSLVLEKHRKYLKDFLQTSSEYTEPTKASEQEIIAKAKKTLSLAEVDEYYNSSIKGEEDKSYLRAIREILEKASFSFSDTIIIFNHIFDPIFSSPDYSYIASLNTYYYNDRKIDSVNAAAEWRAYFQYRFRDIILNFFKDELPGHKITLNYALWTFLHKNILPVYRIHCNIDEGSSAYSQRNKAFEALALLSRRFSFVSEFVANNVANMFYFEKLENQPGIDIYEINIDIQGKQSRGRAQYFSKCTIINNARTENLVNPEDVDASLARFEEARKFNLQERAYQYSVIRFLIRSGLFDPTRALHREYSNAEISGQDLIKGQTELYNTLEKQFNTSIERKGFDHDEKFSQEGNEELDMLIQHIDNTNPSFINYRLATFEAGFFWLAKEDNTVSHIYWAPVLTNWRQRKTGGTLFINSENPIGHEKDEEITSDTPVPQKLLTMVLYLTAFISDKQIGEIDELVKGPALNAAAVSIMSRNISHNIGSHVLSYEKNILSDEQLMLQEKVLENLLTINDSEITISRDVMTNDKIDPQKLLMPYLRSLGNLLGYFQERQDYVGAIASKWYLYFSPVNFQESIYNYFYVPKDIRSTDENNNAKMRNLILNYITYSEGYTNNDIKVLLNWGEGLNENLEVALPAGITGRQGFFTILENFIRNTAKHGDSKTKRGGEIIITIGVKAENRNYYRVEISDNGGTASPDSIVKINQAFGKGLTIEETGEVDEQHKGIKEMQIAAGWLRGIMPEDLLDKSKSNGLPIIIADSVDGHHLRYTFYLRKPKSVLVIVPNKNIYYDEERKLKRQYAHLEGWDFEELQDFFNMGRMFYSFIIIDPSLEKALDEDNPNFKRHSLVRLMLSPFREEEFLQEKSILEEQLYKKWLDGEQEINGQLKARFDKFEGKKPSELIIGISDNKINHKPTPGIALDEKAYEQRIIFRIHNDSPNLFKMFREENKERFERIYFLEGISGNNSTNRLLRNDQKTALWALKMREVALTKILIIDERLWKNQREGNDYEFVYQKFSKKNIQLYSLEPYTVEGKEELYFVNLKKEKMAKLEENGAITWITRDKEDFHFVSLHQGLFDRMLKYCANSLKDYREEKDKSDELFKKFQAGVTAYFRYLIHSGRSKTPYLPSDTAFAQLSALDAALSDCKYSLNELLYSSIIEY